MRLTFLRDSLIAFIIFQGDGSFAAKALLCANFPINFSPNIVFPLIIDSFSSKPPINPPEVSQSSSPIIPFNISNL